MTFPCTKAILVIESADPEAAAEPESKVTPVPSSGVITEAILASTSFNLVPIAAVSTNSASTVMFPETIYSLVCSATKVLSSAASSPIKFSTYSN